MKIHLAGTCRACAATAVIRCWQQVGSRCSKPPCKARQGHLKETRACLGKHTFKLCWHRCGTPCWTDSQRCLFVSSIKHHSGAGRRDSTPCAVNDSPTTHQSIDIKELQVNDHSAVVRTTVLVSFLLARATTEAPSLVLVAHIIILHLHVQDELHDVLVCGLGTDLAHCCCTAAAGGPRLFCCMQPCVCSRTSLGVLQNVWLQPAHPSFEPCAAMVAE